MPKPPKGMKKRESIGRAMSMKQSDSDAPQMEMVSVAVMPPRLPSDMAPPTGLGPADTMGWDESINWQHNNPIETEDSQDQVSKGRKVLRKIGLTRTRERLHSDAPPFMFRQVTYETWRKHYAKDAQGNYHGTHAPAFDCLLKPEDVAKWRFGAPKTIADKYTRGTEALPVYSEVEGLGRVPEYQDPEDYDGPPNGERVLTEEEEGEEARRNLSATTSATTTTTDAAGSLAPRPSDAGQAHRPSNATYGARPSNAGTAYANEIADGKTAAQIIEEAKAKHAAKPKMSWKEQLKKASEFTMLGAGS